MRNLIPFTVIFALLFAAGVDGGVISGDGAYKKFWDNHAVIVCEVANLSSKRSDRADIKVLGVIATDFLVPMAITIEDIPFWETAIEVRLRKGQIVVLCIERTPLGWTLAANGLAFFPYSAVLEVKGLDDPLLARTIESVRKVRSESR